MGEREQMKVRELKEAAHALFIRGRYSQCADTYARIIKLTPKDPNVHVRHAECCRRVGDRQAAIASYRTAAALLLEQGCESRARGALRAALELDPRDAMLLAELARLGQQPAVPTALEDERLYSGATSFFARPGGAQVSAPPPSGGTGFFERFGQAQVSAPPPSGGTGFFERSGGAHAIAPPPPPPPYVLRAAEETPAPGPLPAMPVVPPVSIEVVRRAAGRPAPIPLVNAVASGYVPPPIVQGRPLTQAPVPPRPTVSAPAVRPTSAPVAPPRLSPSPPRPTMAPVPAATARPAASEPRSSPLTMAPVGPLMPYRPELRRLGPNTVALRVSPLARWVVIRSQSPLEVTRSETLPPPEPQPRRATYAPVPGTVIPTLTPRQ